jgi:hypothetical protein
MYTHNYGTQEDESAVVMRSVAFPSVPIIRIITMSPDRPELEDGTVRRGRGSGRGTTWCLNAHGLQIGGCTRNLSRSRHRYTRILFLNANAALFDQPVKFEVP